MMKKFSLLQSQFLKVGLSVGLLLPGMVLAEYDTYSTGFNNDFSKTESVLKPGIDSSNAGSGDSFSENIQKNLERASKLLETGKVEKELREKNANWTKKNDKLKTLLALPDIITQKAIKNREVELEQAEGLLASVKSQNSVNPQFFSMSGMPESCKKGVDFSQFQQLTQQLGSEPFSYIKGEASKLLEEKTKEAKAKRLEKIADIMKYFKELSQKEEGEGQKADAVKNAKNLDQRLALLKENVKKGKEDNKELKGDLVDSFGKLIKNLGEIQDNDKRVAQLGDEFAKSIENSQRAAQQAAQQSIEKLLSNCDKEVKGARTDLVNFQNQMISRGWSPDAAFQDTSSQRSIIAQQIGGNIDSFQCQDVGSDVQSVLMGFAGGSGLSDKLARVRSEKNPTKLLGHVVEAMTEVSNIQSQVGQKIQPLMDDCSNVANVREGLKTRWQQLASSTGGAQQGQGGTAGATQRSGSNGAWGGRNSSSGTSQSTHSANSNSSSGRRN